jgi:hypothetical protein
MSTRGSGMLASALILAACGGGSGPASPSLLEPRPTSSVRHREAGGRGDAVRALAVGHQRACVVRADGRVVCWGYCLGCGQDRPPIEPTLVAGIDDAFAISGDDFQWCALVRGGDVACWTGTQPATRVDGVHGAVEIANACARLADGSVTCWDGRAGLPAAPSPLAHLAQGYGSTCGIRGNGSLVCWSRVFPYPKGAMIQEDGPVEFALPRDVELASTSMMRGTCVKSHARNVECWGGEGAGYIEESSSVEGTGDAVALALAEYHGCVLKRDGRVACWGFNFTGQLGAPREELEERWEAKPIEGLTGAIAVATGSGEPSGGAGSTCVITRAEEVICWGAVAETSGAVIDLTPR